MSFEIRVRDWWKKNPDWPDGREPGATPWEQAWKHSVVATEAEAQSICREWNRTHKPGPLSRKAEYTEL